ncbi:MAG TPA: S4 domain-containing protein, partial [Candidatus Krumholzibacterium sp.]|nr:S4 domain-containing protein [Candidatus Krumholzibacterium sp.]
MSERKDREPSLQKEKEGEYLVDDEFDGSRLDRFVRTLLPGISFPAAQSLIRKKRVLLNGKKASGTARLARGDSVKVMAGDLLPGRTPSPGGSLEKLLGVFGRIGDGIAVLFEDDDLLVIDKPSGLVV